MKYVCMVYQDESTVAAMPEAELQKIVRNCIAYTQELEKGGHHVMSSGLQSVRTAVTLRRRDGKISMTDGPFAETKEFFGGFTIIEAKDLNKAIQLASKFPTGELGCIEVRPVMDPAEEVTDPIDRKLVGCIRGAIQSLCQAEPATVS